MHNKIVFGLSIVVICLLFPLQCKANVAPSSENDHDHHKHHHHNHNHDKKENDQHDHHHEHGETKSGISFGSLFTDCARKFIDFIQPNPFPDDLISDDSLKQPKTIWGSFIDNKDSPHRVFWYEIGFVITAGAFCLLILIFIVVFSCFLCCRRLGGQKINRSQKEGKNGEIKIIDLENWDDANYVNPCHRHFLNLLLFVFILGIFFCVYGAISSAQKSSNGVKQFLPDVRQGLDTLDDYMKMTNRDIERILVQDYKSFSSKFLESLSSAYDQFSIDQLWNQENVSSSLGKTSNLIKEYEQWFTYLEKISLNVSEISGKYDDILRDLDFELENMAQTLNCDSKTADLQAICIEANDLAEKYVKLINSEDMKNTISTVNKTLMGINAFGFSQMKQQLNDEFDRIKTDLQDNMSSKQQEVETELNKVGKELQKFAQAFAYYSNKKMNSSMHKARLDKTEPRMKKSARYVSSTGYTLAGLIAIVAILYFFGLLFSCCGKNPAYSAKNGCVQSKSMCWFSCGTFFAMFSLFFVTVLGLVMFFVGGNLKIMICSENNLQVQRSGFFKMFNRGFRVLIPKINEHMKRYVGGDPNITDPASNLTFDDLMNECATNKTLFEIFNVSAKLDQKKIASFKSQVSEKASDLVRQMESSSPRNLEFIEQFISQMRQIEEILNQTGSYNIGEASDKLDSAIKAIKNAREPALLSKLMAQIPNADFQTGISSFLNRTSQIPDQELNPIVQQSKLMLGKLAEHLKQKLPNLKSIDSKKTADNVNEAIGRKINMAAGELSGMVEQYIDRALEEFSSNVTQCSPIMDVANKIGHRICHCFIDNFNGIWLALAFSLLFLIPTMMIVSRLRSIYARSICYDGSTSGTANSRRCIVDAYSTITDDYGCYRRGSASSYNRPVGHNLQVQKLQYPATSSSMSFSDTDQCLPSTAYFRQTNQ